jgi:hypothetical protein
MKIDPLEFNQNVWNILTQLVEEIGPRPAGSKAEKQALDWLEGQFQTAKLQTIRFPVRYQPDPPYFPYYTLAAAGFLITGLTLATNGWVSLLLPVLILALPEGAQWLQGKLLSYKDGSSNLLALPENSRLEDLDVILCAHVDSARAVPAGPAIWKSWRDKSLYTMMRLANIILIAGILQMLGFDITGLILTLGQSLAFVMAALLILQDIWEQIGSIGRFSPGANDNASGTALLAATAIEFTKKPSMDIKVGYLFTGAEECGLHGARQFTRVMVEKHMNVPVISVDMVGAGSGLRIITQCGTIRPVKTNPHLNEMLKRADPLAVFHAAPRRWGDFVPFIRAGIPAAHIENAGTPLSWATYHTPGDTIDVIDPDMFHHMGEFLNQLIWILEKNKSNPVE